MIQFLDLVGKNAKYSELSHVQFLREVEWGDVSMGQDANGSRSINFNTLMSYFICYVTDVTSRKTHLLHCSVSRGGITRQAKEKGH